MEEHQVVWNEKVATKIIKNLEKRRMEGSYAPTAAQAKEYVVAWAWVIPLALINAFLFWWLSDDRFTITIAGFRGIDRDFLPAIFLLAATLSALFVLTYFMIVGRKSWRTGGLVGVFLLAASVYVLFIYPQLGTVPFQEQYLTLMVMHLPLLAWAGVGVFLTAGHRDPGNRFAFLIKSLEVFIVGGLFIRSIATRLARITRVTRSLGAGDLGATIDDPGHDELSERQRERIPPPAEARQRDDVDAEPGRRPA